MTTKTRIVRIGNSRGILVPKVLLDEAGLPEEVEPRVLDQLRTVDRQRLVKQLGALPSQTLSRNTQRPAGDVRGMTPQAGRRVPPAAAAANPSRG